MEIRGFKDEDQERVRSLFAACFGKELTREEWAWKYEDSPWGSAATVAVVGKEIVAHYGGLNMRFCSKGQSFNVFQPCDVMTHPNFRARIFSRRGAMVRAGEHFYESNAMDFAFGFPNERHAVLGTKQLGYTEHGFVTVLNKRVSGFSLAWNPLLRVETGWDSVDGKELDSLWEEVKDDLGLSIEKNSRYIFWRYRDNPVKKYEPVAVRARYAKKLKGFAICSFNKPDLSVLDFFLTESLGWRIFSRYLGNVARGKDLDHIKVWAHPAEDIFRVLLKDGYVRAKGIPLIFKILNREITPSFLFSHYCYRMGDYDAS
jgi:hypothetical protein